MDNFRLNFLYFSQYGKVFGQFCCLQLKAFTMEGEGGGGGGAGSSTECINCDSHSLKEILEHYLTISRRRRRESRGDYSPIFTSPEATNCFSMITLMIIRENKVIDQFPTPKHQKIWLPF